MILLMVLGGCAAEPATQPAVPPSVQPNAASLATEATLHETPSLPDTILVQLFFPETGTTYRVAQDGRYLVTEPGQPETQQVPLGGSGNVVPPGGLKKLKDALQSVQFDRLPNELPAKVYPSGTTFPGGDKPEALWVFTARTSSGVHTVRIQARAQVPDSFGPLAPLYVALDRVALGDWMLE